jgi:hypothetical protein
MFGLHARAVDIALAAWKRFARRHSGLQNDALTHFCLRCGTDFTIAFGE